MILISNRAEFFHPGRILPEGDGLGGGFGRRHRLCHILHSDRARVWHPTRFLNLAPIYHIHFLLILYRLHQAPHRFHRSLFTDKPEIASRVPL